MQSTQGRLSSYIAVLLYESSSAAPGYRPLYDESFVLIKASSPEEAKEKASTYAKREQTSYRNEQGEEISWSLKQVIDVTAVLDESLEDGSDLYSRHFRNYEAYRLFEPLLAGDV